MRELDSDALKEINGGVFPWPLIPVGIYLIDNIDRAWEGYTDTMKAILT